MKPEFNDLDGNPLTLKTLLHRTLGVLDDTIINQGDTIRIQFPVTAQAAPNLDCMLTLEIKVDVTSEGKTVEFVEKI
jgi:hypothetical protein